MKQQYIIDGYNLLHKFGDLKSCMDQDLEGVRNRFLIRLSGYLQQKRAEFMVVFDGNQRHLPAGQMKAGIKVHFSSKGETADSVIKKLIDRSGKTRELIVVSSDREVADYARLSGRKTISADLFIRQMHASPSVTIEDKAERNLTLSEVEEWMKLFNNPENKF